MLTVALTGGIGCGKSEVSRIFTSLGIPVIDTDVISRQLVTPGSPALVRIIETFGQEFLLPDGHLNRSQMRDLVFNDDQARQQLEHILHPLIEREVARQLEKLETPYAIIVIPLLLETHQQNSTDRILLVDCDAATQRNRVLARDQIDQKLLEKILASQASRQEKLAVADDVINNNSSLTELEAQVVALHGKYQQLGQNKYNAQANPARE